jgi:hypothetical protein
MTEEKKGGRVEGEKINKEIEGFDTRPADNISPIT